MDHNDKQAIEGVFTRLAQVSRQGAPRDPEAEAHIEQYIAKTAGSAYYLAQTVVVQDNALQSAQARIQELEEQLRHQGSAPAPSGGFMSRLFGAAPSPAPRQPAPRAPAQPSASGIPQVGRASPFGGRAGAPQGGQAAQGGGFLAGAAQTAVGVAGGMMLGNMLGGLFAGEANAAPAPQEAATEEPQDESADFDAGFDGDSEW